MDSQSLKPDYMQYQPEQEGVSLKSHIIDFIQTLVVFFAIGTIVYYLLSQPHKVIGSSMVPNFHDGDYILTDKVTYRFSKPKKGDIVVFKNPLDKSQDFIKRIVATAGESIRVEDGNVYINGKALSEPYLPESLTTEEGSFLQEGEEVVVPPQNLAVFGDNRFHSSDSRTWGFIHRTEIIGKVFIRYWPTSSMGLITR